jgi:hypothetical protein
MKVVKPASLTGRSVRRAGSARRWLGFWLGGLCALVAAELALQPLTTALDNVWAPITLDQLDSEVREVRRFTETIATSHFSRSKSRLTGNPPMSGAPTGVILGDSYVEAVEVSDSETMGSVLERSLRAAGFNINIRQYGQFGADIPRHVLIAPEVIKAWNPAWVVVVVTASDIAPNIFSPGAREQLIQLDNGHWVAKSSVGEPRVGRVRRIGEKVLQSSVLLYHMAKRAQEAGLPLIRAKNKARGAASLQSGGLPLPQRAELALSALRDVYGDRLRVLFGADVGLDGRQGPSPAENAVMAGCATLALRCASTRLLMTADRLESVRLSRGFMNSVPGSGHLNAVGHELAARTMLQQLVAPSIGFSPKQAAGP